MRPRFRSRYSVRAAFVRGLDKRGDMRVDEAGADAVGDKIRMRQHRRQERDVGGDAADAEFAQSARRPSAPRRSSSAPGECTMTFASSGSKAALVL